MATFEHLDGSMDGYRADMVDALLDELALADDEHTDVGVTNDDEFSLGIFRDGLVIFENLEDDQQEPRWKFVHSRPELQRLIERLVARDLTYEDVDDWGTGYGPASR